MDERGHWHDVSDEQFEAGRQMGHLLGSRPRYVVSIAIGERVTVIKPGTGERQEATFDKADRNRVHLTPVGNRSPLLYFDLAERVMLRSAAGVEVPAQIWDNRNGKIILRTLPVVDRLV